MDLVNGQGQESSVSCLANVDEPPLRDRRPTLAWYELFRPLFFSPFFLSFLYTAFLFYCHFFRT
jgi:hypothetical protein